MDKKDVEFTPINAGLGFHPFEDGLPYAPRTPAQKIKPGTSATSAGRPVFVSSQTEEARNRIMKEISELDPFWEKPQPPSKSRLSPIETLQKPNEETSTGFGALYLIERTLAFVLDTLLNFSLCSAILSVSVLKADVEKLVIASPTVLLNVFILLCLCHFFLLLGQEMAFGTTVGKRIFGLRLQGSGKEIFFHALFFIPSFFFSGLGLLVALFDEKKRCWHDLASGIQPEKLRW